MAKKPGATAGWNPWASATTVPAQPGPGALGAARNRVQNPNVPLGPRNVPSPTSSGAAGGLPDFTDSIYHTQLAGYNTKLANQQLGFQGQESRLREAFGFDPQYANNPYTRANLLARRAQQRYSGTTNTMASRGQLYSGAMNRARASDVFTSGQETDEARREYMEKLAEIEQGRLGAQSEYAVESSNAYADLLQRLEERALQALQFSAGSSDFDVSYSGGGGGKKKKKRK